MNPRDDGPKVVDLWWDSTAADDHESCVPIALLPTLKRAMSQPGQDPNCGNDK